MCPHQLSGTCSDSPKVPSEEVKQISKGEGRKPSRPSLSCPFVLLSCWTARPAGGQGFRPALPLQA